MARGFYASVDGVARSGRGIYAGVEGAAKKVTKAYASVDGVAQQVWPSYVWQRYRLEDLTTYYWDKYNATYETSYTGDVSVIASYGTQTASWRPYYPRNDPPKIDSSTRTWHNLTIGSWDGWDPPGEWIVRGTSLSNSCYFVTDLEQVSGSVMKFTYSKVARAATKTTYSKGTTSYGQVASTDAAAYPADGAQGGYWFTLATSTTEQVKGALVDTVYGSEGEYPDDGIKGDYWYVRVEV